MTRRKDGRWDGLWLGFDSPAHHNGNTARHANSNAMASKENGVLKVVDMEISRVDKTEDGKGKYLYLRAVAPPVPGGELTVTPDGFMEVTVTEGDLLSATVGQQVQVQISVKVNA